MGDQPDPNQDRESRLDEILAQYLHAIDRGEAIDIQTFASQFPEYSEELIDLMDAASTVEQLAGPRIDELSESEAEELLSEQTLILGAHPSATGDPMLETAAPGPAEDSVPQSNEAEMTLREFGDYQLIEQIGRGGMGVVYLARQKSLDRVVAIKMIRAGEQASKDDIRRFIREAQSAARLQHPHIVDVFEIGEIDGQFFFSMEFVAGHDLSRPEILNELDSKKIATHLRTVALAIDYAHKNQIIHRDLKPANIIIDEHDAPRVTDFGLAKDTRKSRLLAKGVFSVGTPAYMSPEQAEARDDEVGPLSDVYSLGAVLYTLLVKRPPFRAESAVDTIRQVIHTDVIPPSDVDPTIDRRLEVICLKCLQKSGSDRYQSASELADDLDRYLQDLPLAASPPTLPIRMWYWLRDVPVIAAMNGRQVRSATLAQRLFQFVVPVVLVLGFFLLRQSGCFAPQPLRSPVDDQAAQDSGLDEQP